MTMQSQLLAIDKGVSQRAQGRLTDAYHTLQRGQLFHGLSRTYQPKDDDGDVKPPESIRVQQTVSDLVAALRPQYAQLLNVTLEKDVTNTVAAADVVVDGQVLVPKAPVTYLLWLEKRLLDFRTVIDKTPVLDASEKWAKDETNGVYVTEGVLTQSTTKVPTPVVKYPATDKHPAQTDIYNKDVVVGTWTTVKLSGAVEPTRKQQALDRVEALLAAVRQAREEANSIDVAQVRKPGESIFDYVFAPLTT